MKFSSLLSIFKHTLAVTCAFSLLTITASAIAKPNNSASLQDNAQNCPQDFYDVKLPENGKLCQIFAADLPASMILFVPQSPKEVLEFFKKNGSQFTTTKEVKDRFLMQSSDKNTTLIVSADGSGTQVDLLIKSIDSEVIEQSAP